MPDYRIEDRSGNTIGYVRSRSDAYGGDGGETDPTRLYATTGDWVAFWLKTAVMMVLVGLITFLVSFFMGMSLFDPEVSGVAQRIVWAFFTIVPIGFTAWYVSEVHGDFDDRAFADPKRGTSFRRRVLVGAWGWFLTIYTLVLLVWYYDL